MGMVICRGGMIALLSGPLAYVVFKRRYGGLIKTDPERYPINPTTMLAVGDIRRLAWMFGCLTAAGLIAVFFLPWYEDPEYYAAAYGIDGFFDILMSGIRWMTAAFGLTATALLVIAKRVEPAGQKPAPAKVQELR